MVTMSIMFLMIIEKKSIGPDRLESIIFDIIENKPKMNFRPNKHEYYMHY